jgi:SAM-dependent methyltransferase
MFSMASTLPLQRSAGVVSTGNMGEVLRSAGYTAEGFREALAVDGAARRDRADIQFHLRRLPQGDRLATLIKLFWLGVPVASEEAAAALEPHALDALAELGMLTLVGDSVEATLEIFPTGGLLVAGDRVGSGRSEGPADQVIGVMPSSLALMRLTPRRDVDSVLDLGTGSGVQALCAARHARRVVAVDVNPRALEYTKLNAALNGIANVECREGDILDLPDGAEFDLVVCNPPYVISPDTSFILRDGGLVADSFCERLVRRVPAHLKEGGLAAVLVGWVVRDGDWTAPLRSWVEGSGCDALLLHFVTQDPLRYAADWNEGLRSDEDAYAEALDRWLDYYRMLEIEALAWGVVVLRRRTGENWVWAHDYASSDRMQSAGGQVLRMFEAQDYVRGLPHDRALLDARLTLIDDHRLTREVRCRDGGEVVERQILTLEQGFGFRVGVDAYTAELLPHFDGRRPLGEILKEAVDGMPGHVDRAEFTAGALRVVRRLVEAGFLAAGGAQHDDEGERVENRRTAAPPANARGG